MRQTAGTARTSRLVPALLAGLALASAPPLAAQAAARPPAPSTGPGSAAAGEVFAFTYEAGSRYRVLSEVNEEVWVNRKLQSRSAISNRIAFGVDEVGDGGRKGLLRGTFDTEERVEGSAFPVVTESYPSEFWRDSRGVYTIAPDIFMPVVRNCPVFPERPLKPGDSWSAPGEERHDLRLAFGIPDPYAIPFTASYRYEGPVERDGKDLRLLSASYTIFTRPPRPGAWKDVYPLQISGYSDQKIWWDPAMGEASSYEERFKLVFDLSDGSVVEFRGSARARVVEATRMDKAAVKDEVEEAVADLPNVSVSQSELGVTISIEDIQFQPDSAVLMPTELAKIAAIASILAKYPDRDILVAGHTALAGTAAGRQKLSVERAQAVASALAGQGGALAGQDGKSAGSGGAAVAASRLRVVGYGAEKPIADNSTVAGMARNRRVEITILEN